MQEIIYLDINFSENQIESVFNIFYLWVNHGINISVKFNKKQFNHVIIIKCKDNLIRVL